MTEDEKRQQKAMLLLEHQEAMTELAHLRESALKMSEAFGDIGTWLNHAQSEYMGGFDKQKKELNIKIRNNIFHYQHGLDFDAALKVMDEIANMERKVSGLAQRKGNLGLK